MTYHIKISRTRIVYDYTLLAIEARNQEEAVNEAHSLVQIHNKNLPWQLDYEDKPEYNFEVESVSDE